MAEKSSIQNKSTLFGTKVDDVLTVNHSQITVKAGKGKDSIYIN